MANDPRAFVWDAIHGTTFLGDLPGGGQSIADISADGSVVIGRDGFGATEEAFVWTRDGGMVGLGDRTRAVALTADGCSAVGTLLHAQYVGDSVVIWDPEAGTQRTLESILRDAGVTIPLGGLRAPIGISDDGTTVAGNGAYGGPWLVVVPEPGTAPLLALGFAGLARR